MWLLLRVVIGLHPGTGWIPRGYFPRDRPRADRQIAAVLSLVRHAGWAALGRSGVSRTPMSRTLAAPEEGRGPWCELDRGPTLNNWGGPYRRMEVITMAVVAMLVAAGVVALIFVGLFFVVWGALLAMFALDKPEAARWPGVHSRHR
jgi:hypothetical protein